MQCPYCSYPDSRVIDSRPSDKTIRRRRECIKCKKRFTTYEQIETIALVVVKKDQSRQPYDRSKVLGGIMRACEKRPVSLAQMEALADDVESELYRKMSREVESSEIGEMVIERLRTLDEVAYVRFASVYKRFNDLQSFMNELQSLIKE